MSLEFVKSRKQKDHLVHKGFRFLIKKTGNINTWRCVEHRRFKCSGKVFTADNKIIRVKDEHNHTPDSAKIEVKKIRARIRAAAQNTRDQPQVIIASCTEGISKSASVQLPSVRAMKRTIRKDRADSESFATPTSLADLKIPEVFRKTATGENFLLFDSGSSTDRILIFGTMKNVQHLLNSPDWFAEGTFKVAPEFFDQVIT